MIKILLDQNIPAPFLLWLQNILHEKVKVYSTRTLGMDRMSDYEIFEYGQKNGMIIMTYDEDFQNPQMIPHIPGYGVVRLNTYPTGLHHTKEAILRLLELYPVDRWEKASIIVDQHKIRYRKK
ncbi:DUF5615 family PIN-like protein [candidate division KSB1 bacterium]|nr:DUF5615 family PIN-like protein [candidate division KSB1 bacterium]